MGLCLYIHKAWSVISSGVLLTLSFMIVLKLGPITWVRNKLGGSNGIKGFKIDTP